jgi:hypothetical protein
VKGTSYIETGGMSGDINKKGSVLFKLTDLLEKGVTLERGIFRKMGLGMQVGRGSYTSECKSQMPGNRSLIFF